MQEVMEKGETLVNLAREIKPKIRINNSELLETSGLKIAHYHDGRNSPHRGVTIAYKALGRNPKNIEIATAICHKSDCFTKKIGTRTAIEHFQAGKTVVVPVYFGGVIHTLNCMFGEDY